MKKIFWILGAIILVVIIGLRNKNEKLYNENHSSETTFQSLGIGEIGHLDNGNEMVSLGIDLDSYNEMLKSTQANDKRGWAELVLAGKIFLVDCKTSVRVIDRSMFLRRVRILEGPQKDLAGWCAYEYVKR